MTKVQQIVSENKNFDYLSLKGKVVIVGTNNNYESYEFGHVAVAKKVYQILNQVL